MIKEVGSAIVKEMQMNSGEPAEKCPVARALPEMPKSMQDLPIHRGFPVPWFVDHLPDGTPEFRAMDGNKLVAAIKQSLCWVCGKKLKAGINCFVIGPMCAVNRVSAEPPSHPECARYSARACPFLSRPHMRRREDALTATFEDQAGMAIKRNPGVTLLWFCRDYRIERDGDKRGVLFRIGRQVGVEWFCESRAATREEVMTSIKSGLPILMQAAEQGGSADVALLMNMYHDALKLVPR